MDQIVALDSEWTHTFYPDAKLVVACVYIHGRPRFFTGPSPVQELVRTLEPGDTLVGQNLGFDIKNLGLEKYINCQTADTLVLSWLIDENGQHSLDALVKSILGRTLEKPLRVYAKDPVVYWKDKNTPIWEAPFEEVKKYCQDDTYAVLELYPRLLKGVSNRLKAWYYKVEDKLVRQVGSRIETQGLAIDEKRRQEVESELADSLDRAYRDLVGQVGYEFSPSSPKQVAQVLFEDVFEVTERQQVGFLKTCSHGKPPANCCGVERPKYGRVSVERKGRNLSNKRTTKTGRPSTDKNTLALYADDEVVDGLLEWRETHKLLNTYVGAFPRFTKDGRLYYGLNMWGTVTGRASSSKPNMQNVPIRGDKGKLIRSLFVAGGECQLICADYSQIEYRLLAEFSQDPSLLGIWKDEDADVHAATASLILDVAEPSREERALGKNLNFATIYGAGPRKIASTVSKEGYPLDERRAKVFIKKYYEKMPRVAEWKEEVWSFARKNNYVVLPSGRRRNLPWINDWDHAKRAYAERQAINVFPQGTAADIIKIAMVRCMEEGIYPSLQVHDELLFEVRAPGALSIASAVKRLMNLASKELDIGVKIVADVKIVDNWSEKE
jgi:DNA polymerase I-like protein with 3'-5' exonuclease and polymerase domains